MIYKVGTCSPSDPALRLAVEIILGGGIVAVPTETVYGLAANALDEAAVRKVFLAKGRPFIDPLIAHVPDFPRWKNSGSKRERAEARGGVLPGADNIRA